MLAVLFLIASILYSSVGHAGASGYLAAMAFANVEPAIMKPTALVLNLVVGTIAFVRFRRAGFFAFDVWWPFAIASAPFAFVGGAMTLPGHWYRTLVGIVLFAAAARLIVETRPPASVRHRIPRVPALIAGAGIGLLSGLTGTGGGIFLSPLLLFTGWAETREAGGVSAAFILANSLAGLAGNFAAVRVLPDALPLWILVVSAGGLLGTELGTRRVAPLTFRRLLAIVLVVAGLKLALS